MNHSAARSPVGPIAVTSWLPSVPYPVAQGKGFWSPVTSTINWCEEDYYATIYSAEIVNAMTNLLFVYLAFKGLVSCRENGHDAIFSVAFIGYLLIGLGSFLFHTTLSYPMQLVDELSMIYSTCIMCYATFAFKKSRRFSNGLGICLVALATFITLYYHYLQDPAFHQNAYALLTAVVVFRNMYVMELALRPSQRREEREKEDRQRGRTISPEELAKRAAADRRDGEILHSMWWLVGLGLAVFLGGFAVWNLDNALCPTLRAWRRHVGLPWGMLLEGHGLWHLMTGSGAYFAIIWLIWLRHCLNGRQDEFELTWPSIFTSFPDIIRVDKAAVTNGQHYANKHHEANGHSQNASAKKPQ